MQNLWERKQVAKLEHGLDALFPTREGNMTGDINYLPGQVAVNTLSSYRHVGLM